MKGKNERFGLGAGIGDRHPAPSPLELFLAFPSHGDADLEAAVRRGVSRFRSRSGIGLVTRTIADAPQSESKAAAAWVRDQLLIHAAGLIVIEQSSFGCGRADGLGAGIGLPRLVAFHDDGPRSRVRADGGSGADHGGWGSPCELEDLTFEWLQITHLEMSAYRERRAHAARATQPLRTSCLRAWEMAEEPAQQRVARRLRMPTRQVSRLLMRDGEFTALDVARLAVLASELAMPLAADRPAVSGDPQSVLTAREWSAFEQARTMYNWEPSFAAAVLRLGVERLAERRELELAGEPSRFALNTASHWRRLSKEVV